MYYAFVMKATHISDRECYDAFLHLFSAFRSQRDGATSKCGSSCLRIRNMLDPSE